MSRKILIAGNESPLLGAVEREIAGRAERYAVTGIANRFSSAEQAAPLADSSSACSSLEWNPGSPVSARTLVLAAENRLGGINEAVLVCDPPAIRRTAASVTLADIEILTNDHIKSWLYLLKEITAAFREQGGGMLALVYNEAAGSGGRDEPMDLLGSVALAAFKSLAAGLLSASASEPYVTIGFSNAEAGDDSGFAAFIAKQLDEGGRRGGGKLHKYGKQGFFR